MQRKGLGLTSSHFSLNPAYMNIKLGEDRDV
jgi:hypothetical protein